MVLARSRSIVVLPVPGLPTISVLCIVLCCLFIMCFCSSFELPFICFAILMFRLYMCDMFLTLPVF